MQQTLFQVLGNQTQKPLSLRRLHSTGKIYKQKTQLSQLYSMVADDKLHIHTHRGKKTERKTKVS